MKRFLLAVCGVIGGLFTVLHLLFWRMFDWGHELPKLSAVNQGIMQVMNISFLFILVFSTIATFILARRRAFDRGEKMFLGLFGGFYLWRAALEVPFFGWAVSGVVIIALCLTLAWGYLWNAFERPSAPVAA